MNTSLTKTPPVSSRGMMPGPLTGKAREDYVRSTARTAYHQCGTAKMGTDEHAVADGALRVRSVRDLRIADASVMPRITTGNTMAPCVVIWRAGGRHADPCARAARRKGKVLNGPGAIAVGPRSRLPEAARRPIGHNAPKLSSKDRRSESEGRRSTRRVAGRAGARGDSRETVH